jgi:SIR2-like domain
MFMRSAKEYFPLNSDPQQNLYAYLHDKVDRYWRAQGAPLGPNFEDVLYVVTQLAAMPPEAGKEKFTPALGAFVEVCTFPDVGIGLEGTAVDSSKMMCLAERLVFDLIDELRRRCNNASRNSKASDVLRRFFDLLGCEFDVAVVTTNYDDLIYRAFPGIETGFDPSDGLFKQERILQRKCWPCLLHLHGSVHFDEVPVPSGKVKLVRWNNDLTSHFYQHRGSTTPRYSIAGYASPASPIIVGYAKAEKIGDPPYRTYYSELARLVYQSDALLILGHSLGLGDTHLREACVDYSDARKRRIVVIDYANGKIDEASTAARAMRIFAYDAQYDTWLASHSDGQRMSTLKAAKEFERCPEEGHRLSLWYGGMLEACKNGEKIVAELDSDAQEHAH